MEPYKTLEELDSMTRASRVEYLLARRRTSFEESKAAGKIPEDRMAEAERNFAEDEAGVLANKNLLENIPLRTILDLVFIEASFHRGHLTCDDHSGLLDGVNRLNEATEAMNARHMAMEHKGGLQALLKALADAVPPTGPVVDTIMDTGDGPVEVRVRTFPPE